MLRAIRDRLLSLVLASWLNEAEPERIFILGKSLVQEVCAEVEPKVLMAFGSDLVRRAVELENGFPEGATQAEIVVTRQLPGQLPEVVDAEYVPETGQKWVA